MDEWYAPFLDAAREKWHTKSGILSASALLLLLLLGLFTAIDFSKLTKFHWIVLAVLQGALLAFWWHTHLPRVRRNHLGIGVAIDHEDDTAARQLRSDFVRTLRERVLSSRLRSPVHFIEIKQSVSATLEGPEQAHALLKSTGLHFLLYGRSRRREQEGHAVFIIDLKGMVVHSPIQVDVSRRFSDDFTSVLPKQIGLVETVAGGEIAARHIDIVTRYIVGTAAALSRDFLLAEELLLGAHERVNALRGLGPDKLLERVIAARLVDLYDARLHFLGQWYTLKRDVKALVESESTVAKLRRYAPGHYGAKLAAATCAFCLRKDLPAARAEIDSCKGEDDAAWLYSKAFLHLYEGDLDQAYKAYRDAFGRRHTAPDLPVQVEHFIQQVLEGEPEKVLLLYGLGLINRKAKGDLVAARNDFAQLLQYLDPQSQEKHVRIVGQWVRELDAELSDEDRCRGQGSN